MMIRIATLLELRPDPVILSKRDYMNFFRLGTFPVISIDDDKWSWFSYYRYVLSPGRTFDSNQAYFKKIKFLPYCT